MTFVASLLQVLQNDWRLTLAAGLVTYAIGLATYRLFLHPLANVPGPKLAALTSWWEVYHQVWRDGQLPFELLELHKRYGPIIRISPREVHIADPDFYEKIYYMRSPFGKDKFYYQVGLGPAEFFNTPDNARHRALREPLNPFFSRRSVIDNMLPIVLEELAKCRAHLAELELHGKFANLDNAFRCMTTDIISKACWGIDEDMISQKDFSPEKVYYLGQIPKNIWPRIYFPTVTRIMNLIPPKYIKMMNKDIGTFFDALAMIIRKAGEVKDEVEREGLGSSQPTIFHVLLNKEARAAQGKVPLTAVDMGAVGWLFYAAAVETTASALSQLTFGTLNNPRVLKKLQAELDEAIPDRSQPLSWQRLEQLPYLGAVIQEGVRLSYGVTSRLPRTVPAGGLTYNKYHIPEGYTVGMSSLTTHTDERVYPNPYELIPERWLGPEKVPEKYMVSFTKGSRQCLGMNLAYCELYTITAFFFRNYDMELYDVGVEDLRITHDYFNSWTSPGARQLKVKFKERM